jgi:UDP-3-O-[3-hydroxymyristoyl] N-acetylglucosamine deacetylase
VARRRTIARSAALEGVGVHSGAAVRLDLQPGEAGQGIVFRRRDLAGSPAIPAHADAFTGGRNATRLAVGSAEVSTVEHLLAACAGLEIDDLIAELDGPELPILDGSAAGFAVALFEAGAMIVAGERRRRRLVRPIAVRDGEKSAALVPADEVAYDVTIRFADSAIGEQRFVHRQTPERFMADIAGARTFGFLADLDRLHAAGLGRGASLANTVAIADGRVVNEDGLRWPDEFVRHKILDAMGDMALLGAPFLARFEAVAPGHALNAALVRAALDAPDAWTWEAA